MIVLEINLLDCCRLDLQHKKKIKVLIKWKRLHVNVIICQIVKHFHELKQETYWDSSKLFFYIIIVENLYPRDCHERKAREKWGV